MQGADPVEAVLRFSSKSAAWVAERMSHGSDVKVISPPELKNLIKKKALWYFPGFVTSWKIMQIGHILLGQGEYVDTNALCW